MRSAAVAVRLVHPGGDDASSAAPPGGTSARAAESAGSLTRASPRVLLVDDQDDFRQVLRTLLEQFSFEVIEAEDGIEGLARTLDHAPDLILLDERMPRLRGSEVATRLVSAGVTTPIVLVSAATGIEDIARRIGTPYWLRKPFGLSELARVLTAAGFDVT